MSLIPESAGYVEQVQAFFLAFRGSGVSLSPLDADLLLDWAARGVPYDVVCRGIRLAAEAAARDARPDDARLGSLRRCKRLVEAEFRRYLGKAVGRGKAASQSPDEVARKRRKAALAKLRKAARDAPAPEMLRACEAAAAVLERCQSDDPAEVARAVARADDVLALAYLRAMPFAVRRDIVAEAHRRAGEKPVDASAAARRDALRAHRVALARSRGGLARLA